VHDPVPHYFDARPAVGSHRRQVELALADVTLTLTTDRGVFSGDRVDPGTRLLLQEAPPPPAEGNLLDLGCGYGPMAVTLALRAPAATVWAVDVNERAVALCAENARANDATKVVATLVDADGRAVGKPVDWPPLDLIWSNPPIRVGKAALHRLLAVWLDRLAPTGRAALVVQKHLGADSLAAWLTAEGWATTRLTSRAGYRLLDVQPRSAAGSA
jgi:16S rRNA (guanine1207-N2)-methyltransferase